MRKVCEVTSSPVALMIRLTLVLLVMLLVSCTSTVELTPDKENFLRSAIIQHDAQILYFNKVGLSSPGVGYTELFSPTGGVPTHWCMRDGIVLTEQRIYAVWNLFQVDFPRECFPVESRHHNQRNYVSRWNYSDVASVEKRKLHPKLNSQIIRLVFSDSDYIDIFYWHSGEVARLYKMLTERIKTGS